jgi:hypothetical protein
MASDLNQAFLDAAVLFDSRRRWNLIESVSARSRCRSGAMPESYLR